jgi:hypothetical protein
MTRNKVAAKYVNVMDRVRPVIHPVKPPYTVIRKMDGDWENVDLVVTTWGDSTLRSLVRRGLQGE